MPEAETEHAVEAPVTHDEPIKNMFADHSAPVDESPEALVESQAIVESTEPPVAVQELEDAMTELEALASDSAFFDEPAETDRFADASAPGPFEAKRVRRRTRFLDRRTSSRGLRRTRRLR